MKLMLQGLSKVYPYLDFSCDLLVFSTEVDLLELDDLKSLKVIIKYQPKELIIYRGSLLLLKVLGKLCLKKMVVINIDKALIHY